MRHLLASMGPRCLVIGENRKFGGVFILIFVSMTSKSWAYHLVCVTDRDIFAAHRQFIFVFLKMLTLIHKSAN